MIVKINEILGSEYILDTVNIYLRKVKGEGIKDSYMGFINDWGQGYREIVLSKEEYERVSGGYVKWVR